MKSFQLLKKRKCERWWFSRNHGNQLLFIWIDKLLEIWLILITADMTSFFFCTAVQKRKKNKSIVLCSSFIHRGWGRTDAIPNKVPSPIWPEIILAIQRKFHYSCLLRICHLDSIPITYWNFVSTGSFSSSHEPSGKFVQHKKYTVTIHWMYGFQFQNGKNINKNAFQ